MDSELWQKEKSALSAMLKEKIVGNKASFTYDELMQKELPDFLRIYLKSQARRLLQEEKPMSCRQSDRYPFDDPQVRENLERLMGVLLLKTKFTRAELQRWVELGIKFQMEVLIRPREALEGLFFKREKTRRKEDIVKVVMQLAQGRHYMLNLAQNLKNASEQVDVASFSYLARKAEEETYGSKPLAAFLKDVSTLEGFFNLSGRMNGEFLTTEVIVGLLKERGLDDVAEGIKGIADERETDVWTYEDVEAVLERQLVLRGLSEADNGAVATESSETKQSRPSKPQGSPKVSSEMLEEAIVEARSAVVSNGLLENLFTRPAPKPEPAREPSRRKASPPRLSFGVVEEDEGVFFVHRRNIERQPPGPYPSLRSLISHKERKIFTRKLFNKDKGAYHAFVDKLEATDKWKEAKLIIDEELSRHQLSPFCREAVRLGDLVFSRYFSRKP